MTFTIVMVVFFALSLVGLPIVWSLLVATIVYMMMSDGGYTLEGLYLAFRRRGRAVPSPGGADVHRSGRAHERRRGQRPAHRFRAHLPRLSAGRARRRDGLLLHGLRRDLGVGSRRLGGGR